MKLMHSHYSAFRNSFLILVLLGNLPPAFSQLKKVAVLGSSTAYGLITSPDSSWVRRFSNYYKNQLGVLDTVYNLALSGYTVYQGMPSSYVPPQGRPQPDPLRNITEAQRLLSDLSNPANGVVIVSFPSNGFDTYTIAEILNAFQILYDSAIRTGNKCYVTTTLPRTALSFGTSAVKRKLAVLKDSIINRFGVANTINFYDGMYNPADSTILPIYSAGDAVHLNNAGHRELFERIRAKNVLNLPPVQYRSNVTTTGVWSDAASWQTLNGTSWVAATIPPGSGSGTITIQNGDSIRINSYTEIDQVIIEPGGVLTMFNVTGNPPAKITVGLNDGPGDDIVVNGNGRLYISSNAILSGNGTVVNNIGGLLTIRNRGVLEVNTRNEGTIWVNSTGIVRNRTVTNNNTLVLADFTLHLINSTFINNDSVSITGTGSTFIADSTLTGGSFNNTATGIVARQSATGVTSFNQSIAVINNGSISGLGEYVFYNVSPVSKGRISPGLSPGRLRVNPAFITSRTPTIDIEISSTGAVQGTNYDHLIISDIAPTAKNISGATLNVTDNASDPIGTVYTIITPAAGTIAGAFANVNLPPTLSTLNYNNGNFITLTRVSGLPLKWGSFTAINKDQRALLSWSTLQESNTSHFDIEHSTDGVRFFVIGKQSAAGNSDEIKHYQFTHENPLQGTVNYYRLKQIDQDGKSSYSKTLTLQFENNKGSQVEVRPNPVRDQMQLIVRTENADIVLTDLNGKKFRSMRLSKGTHSINISDLPAGAYQLSVYHNEKRIEGLRIIKL